MSEYNQTSFLGGMNLLSDDTRLKPTEYRLGFNIRNRYDVLDEIRESVQDTALAAAHPGVIQELVTFGNYIIVFVAGQAYYRYYSAFGWTRIDGFGMSPTAPRYWTCAVPVATTNYVRVAATVASYAPDAQTKIHQLNIVSGAAGGNLPGLLVQDNINQPQFIFIDANGNVAVRTTQTYDQWKVDYAISTGVMTLDEREYVPIGNCMAFVDGILYIASPDGTEFYRSVSGRPLDFMVNVATDGSAGGNAHTTAYGVGVGPIRCLRGMADGSLFVAAGNANFSVVKNTSNIAPLMFGEFVYIRKYLFEATCMDDRSIIDTLGDTRFIDLTGVRSFNGIQQYQMEGRNSPFTANIQLALKGIVQDVTAAILYDNYEYYALNTIFGPAIAVYDTISSCWTGFDLYQTGGKKIKQFAKIELGVTRLFAVTEDNKLYTLYSGTSYNTGIVLTAAISANTLYNDQNVKLNNAKSEVKPLDFRCILNRIYVDSEVTLTPIIDNRVSTNVPPIVKNITYSPPLTVFSGSFTLPDINSQLTNLYFPMPNCEQGWKVSMLLSWTGGGSITQFSMTLKDEAPRNPLKTQASTK